MQPCCCTSAASERNCQRPARPSPLPADAEKSMPLLHAPESASYIACDAPPLPTLALMMRTPGCAGRAGNNRCITRLQRACKSACPDAAPAARRSHTAGRAAAMGSRSRPSSQPCPKHTCERQRWMQSITLSSQKAPNWLALQMCSATCTRWQVAHGDL